MIKKIVLGATIAGVLASTAACGKFTEPYKDATVSVRNDSPADVGSMPDGFNNFASKCDHGNRVYTLYHNNAAYGGIAVVANDPSCKGVR